MSKETPEEVNPYVALEMKNWRAWGSWFSWGSPVGLSIFLLALTAIIWVIANLF